MLMSWFIHLAPLAGVNCWLTMALTGIMRWLVPAIRLAGMFLWPWQKRKRKRGNLQVFCQPSACTKWLASYQPKQVTELSPSPWTGSNIRSWVGGLCRVTGWKMWIQGGAKNWIQCPCSLLDHGFILRGIISLHWAENSVLGWLEFGRRRRTRELSHSYLSVTLRKTFDLRSESQSPHLWKKEEGCLPSQGTEFRGTIETWALPSFLFCKMEVMMAPIW